MKSILTLLSVVCVASLGFTGCAASAKQCPTKCPPTQTCPMTKKPCASPNACCAKTPANCPAKKSATSCSQ